MLHGDQLGVMVSLQWFWGFGPSSWTLEQVNFEGHGLIICVRLGKHGIAFQSCEGAVITVVTAVGRGPTPFSAPLCPELTVVPTSLHAGSPTLTL